MSNMTDSLIPYLCATCGTQYPPSDEPPAACPMCLDDRQYVGANGQEWTTLVRLRMAHNNTLREEEPSLHSINCAPSFGIGQRAFVVQTPAGNLLWDCLALIDDATVARVNELGGLRAIAISHPHYYTTMIEWSRAFGGVPIILHEAERPWVMRPDPCIEFWSGERRELFGGLSLIRSGGHFAGYQVCHWPAGAEGSGVLLAGDQPQIGLNPEIVSFMWSYPNFLPLGPAAIKQILASLDPLAYDRLYGAFAARGHGVVKQNAKQVVARSAARVLELIRE
jgi:glyoxylase-like metal-dependent hydrolase (beta-lactamase superfamily II)